MIVGRRMTRLTNETLTVADVARMVAVGFTLLGLVYYAGYQSRRLDTLEFNQRNVMVRQEELIRTDNEIRVELEKIRGLLDGHNKMSFSLLKGDG